MCAWTVFGDTYETDSDFSNGTKSVRAKMNKKILLRFVRTWIVVYNDAPFTDITMKIYHDTASTELQGDLLYSSTTTLTKAEIVTLENGIKEIYFEFDDVELDENNYYHFTLSGSSSGFTVDTTVAWKTSFPRPVYDDGFSQSFRALPGFPYTLSLIGAEF